MCLIFSCTLCAIMSAHSVLIKIGDLIDSSVQFPIESAMFCAASDDSMTTSAHLAMSVILMSCTCFQ